MAAAVVLVVAAAHARAQAPTSLSDSAFARLIADLSEAPGYFDTDNLISNEDSYLHVIGTLRRVGVTGGAYIGVGPDQNFSYIAAIRPRVAFIVDIRRDNLLHHLLLKAIFGASRGRIDYLCLLFGRSVPADTVGWGAKDIDALLRHIDTVRATTSSAARARALVAERLGRMAVSLSSDERATITRFHGTFIAQGPGLRFNTFGRPPQPYYPTLGRLMTETDRTGRKASYLATESDFRFVKSLQDRNLVIPVVGDFAGERSLRGVGAWIRRHGEVVSAFYTSNVEQYLFRDGTFARYAASVRTLPRDSRSVILRSYFQGGHPQQVSGYHATQVAQSLSRFVSITEAEGFASFRDLVWRDLITP